MLSIRTMVLFRTMRIVARIGGSFCHGRLWASAELAEESEGSDVLDADDINVEGRYLVNGDCLLPLIAGAKPGAAYRWDVH